MKKTSILPILLLSCSQIVLANDPTKSYEQTSYHLTRTAGSELAGHSMPTLLHHDLETVKRTMIPRSISTPPSHKMSGYLVNSGLYNPYWLQEYHGDKGIFILTQDSSFHALKPMEFKYTPLDMLPTALDISTLPSGSIHSEITAIMIKQIVAIIKQLVKEDDHLKSIDLTSSRESILALRTLIPMSIKKISGVVLGRQFNEYRKPIIAKTGERTSSLLRTN